MCRYGNAGNDLKISSSSREVEGGHLHSPLSFGDFGYGYAPFALFSLPLDRVMGTDAGKISMCKVSQDADDVGCVTNAPDGPTECPMDRFLYLSSSFSCFVSVTA